MAWLAVDKDGAMWIYSDKPKRGGEKWRCPRKSTSCMEVHDTLVEIASLPSFTWENEPLEIKVTWDDETLKSLEDK